MAQFGEIAGIKRGITIPEPYQANKIPSHWPKSPKREVHGTLVAISGLRLHDRGTELMHPGSRAFPRFAIVELTATDENHARPGGRIDSVLYVGFFEATQGGIVTVGQKVILRNLVVGYVAGFSDVHEPNHLNVLYIADEQFAEKYIKPYEDRELVKLGLTLGDEVLFE